MDQNEIEQLQAWQTVVRAEKKEREASRPRTYSGKENAAWEASLPFTAATWSGTYDPDIVSRFDCYAIPSDAARRYESAYNSTGGGLIGGTIMLLAYKPGQELYGTRYHYSVDCGPNSEYSYSGCLPDDCNGLTIEEAGERVLLEVVKHSTGGNHWTKPPFSIQIDARGAIAAVQG
jgi:hypothetical protein